MADVTVTLDDDGSAHVRLAPEGEVRYAVPLGELEETETVTALDAIVLEFDYYGRLIGIDVTGSAASVLPPALLDAAQPRRS